MEEPQTAVSALLGLISVMYWWQLLDDWLLLYPPQVEHLWFQQKLVEASSHTREGLCALWHRAYSHAYDWWPLPVSVGLRSPWPWINFNWPGQVGVSSNDYCHTSPYPHTGLQCNKPHPNNLTLLHVVARNTTKCWHRYNAPFASWKCAECQDSNMYIFMYHEFPLLTMCTAIELPLERK